MPGVTGGLRPVFNNLQIFLFLLLEALCYIRSSKDGKEKTCAGKQRGFGTNGTLIILLSMTSNPLKLKRLEVDHSMLNAGANDIWPGAQLLKADFCW